MIDCLIETIGLICVGNIWVSACIMGSALFILVNNEVIISLFSKWYTELILVMVVWFVIQRDESDITYIIDALASVILLIIVFANERIQMVLNNVVLCSLGKYSMELFLIHPLVYDKIGKSVVYNTLIKFGVLNTLAYIMAWLFSLIIMLVLVVPVRKIIEFIFSILRNSLEIPIIRTLKTI